MNKFLHHIYHKYKRPVRLVLLFFLGIFLLEKAFVGGIYLKDYADTKALQKQHTNFDNGSADLSYYLKPDNTEVDLGAAFADDLLKSFSDNPENALDKLNYDLLQERGYEVDSEQFLIKIASVAALIKENGYELSYIDHYDKLTSEGIIFTFTLVKPFAEAANEFQYDPFERLDFPMTVYYNNGIPESYLPFPEPAINNYASRYGLIK